MVRITARQANAQLEAIAKKISDGYTDHEIIRDLKIATSSFYVYKSKIFKKYGDIAAKKTEQSLEFEAEILKDRYIRLYRQLEIKMASPDEDLTDIAMAAEIAAFIATNIFKLETEGLRARQGRPLHLNEQKAIRYLGVIPAGVSESDTPSPTTSTEEQDSQSTDQPGFRQTEGKVF